MNEASEKSPSTGILQYLAIFFSILFSMAGIIFFLSGGKNYLDFPSKKSETLIGRDLAPSVLLSDDLNKAMPNLVGSKINKKSTVISQYPGCDTTDIALENGQVWAACNVGATSVFNGYLADEKDSPLAGNDTAGKVFNANYGGMASNYNSSRIPSNTCMWDRDKQKCKIGIPDWQSDFRAGKLEHWFEWGTSGTSDIRGPCAIGYHVPTVDEWKLTIKLLESRNKVVSTLRLSSLGFRNESDSPFIAQGDSAYYFASSPNLNGFYHLTAMVSGICLVFQNSAIQTEFPVRCIKN